MEEVIKNKVSESGLITLDLELYYPKGETMVFDMKNYLFMGLILKEKEFREQMKNLNLQPFNGKNIALTCTADAIIPVWAYMLAASYFEPVAGQVVFGNEDFLHKTMFLQNLSKINIEEYRDKRVVIKGCGELSISETAYVAVTQILRPVVKSIMYGEPCSTVPIYKKAQANKQG